MRKKSFYQGEVAAKATGMTDYTVWDNAGLDPGRVPLPVEKHESSSSLEVGKKKKKMKKTANSALVSAFRDEMQKIGFGFAAATPAGSPGAGGGMAGVPAMARGGVVSSKSKKSLGPRIRIVSSKSRKQY